MRDTAGNTINFSGKWTVINYWASWCAPCQKEIPELNRFHQQHQKGDVQLVGVNFDNPADPAQLSAIIKKAGVLFPTLQSDPASQLGINEIPGVPYTVIISPDGKVQARLSGPQTLASLDRAIAW